MTFIESVRSCFVKYADFNGCARRSEYWWFMLFGLVGTLSFEIVSDRLSWAFTVATFLPSIAVTARRLHDTDRSGWLQLIALIPIIGWVPFIIWCTQQGKIPNRFSPPHAAEARPLA